MRCKDCDACHTRVGWVGLIASILIGVFTIVIGILSNSKALMAASLCTGIDVATAMTVLLGLKFSNKPIDIEHPYGHGKVEFIVVGGISVLLMCSAGILLFHSGKSIYRGDPGPENLITLVVAFIAAFLNELKFRYASCVGSHFNSPAINSHAEHARVDAISFAAVGIGVIFARIGIHFMDPLIAIFEIVHIFKASLKMLKNSIRSLMDVSLPKTRKSEIQKMAAAVKGVRGIKYLFARQLGQHIWIELSIFVDPEITVYEGKIISENVKNFILNNLENIGNVQVQFLSSAA